MLRLIGLVVVVAIAVLGWPAFQRWYSGDATPKETIDAVRGKLGDAINPGSSQGGGSGTATTSASPNPAAATPQAPVPAPASPPEPMSANKLMRDMMKD